MLKLRSGLFVLDRKSRLDEHGSVADVRYPVLLNGREVTIINETYVDVEAYYHLAELDTDIVILGTASGGNACPKKLVLVAFNINGLVHASPEFGNCSEDPTFMANSSSLQINFPYGDNPIGESWLYDSGGMRRIKPRRQG